MNGCWVTQILCTLPIASEIKYIKSTRGTHDTHDLWRRSLLWNNKIKKTQTREKGELNGATLLTDNDDDVFMF